MITTVTETSLMWIDLVTISDPIRPAFYRLDLA